MTRRTNVARSARQWCAYYRHLGLPAEVCDGVVYCRTSDWVGVLMLPEPLAQGVFREIPCQPPALYRPRRGTIPTRWRLFVRPDCSPRGEDLYALDRRGGSLSPPHTVVELPTDIEDRAGKRCQWVRLPRSGAPLPPLTAVLVTALAADLFRSGGPEESASFGRNAQTQVRP